jgi:hypothetical protein
LSIPAFQAACQTHEARVGANERGSNSKPANEASFADWDINRDDYIMESEFATGFSHGHWFADADKDKDNYLNQDEFKAGTDKLGLPAKWDANGDGRVDKNEVAQVGGKNNFRKWDSDKSGDLNQDEVDAAVFSMWDPDSDGRIDQDEFAVGWFGYLDADHDNRLAAAEFDKGFKG